MQEKLTELGDLLSRRIRIALLWMALICGSMLSAGQIVHWLYPNTWQPVEATIQSVQGSRGSGRSPSWVLRARAAYEVSGRAYVAGADVFNDTDRAVVLAEAGKWPAGRTFTLYVDTTNPERVSRFPDGGREGAIVAAVLLTPLAVSIAAFIAFLMRRRRQVPP